MKNLILVALAIGLGVLVTSFTNDAKINTVKTQNQSAAMNDDYAKQWKEINELEQKGLIKSALEKVMTLCERAKKDKNDPQIIKTILYRERYGSQLEEYGFENSLRTFQSEVETLNGPAKAIMHFMIGKSLANYLQSNQWKFSNRTTSPGFKPEELETWSIQHFIEEIDKQFDLALKDESLKNAPIGEYDAITTKTQNTDHLRPTIYDVIAHQILDYYVNPNSFLTEPVYKFYLDQEIVFASAKEFVKYEFTSQDSTSRLLKATRIFQNVLRLHLAKNNKPALVEADLKRLQFGLNNSTLAEKGQKYYDALLELNTNNESDRLVAPMISMALARLYQSSSTHLNQEKNNLKSAYEIYKKISEDFPKSREATEAKNQMISLSALSMNIRSEMVYPELENMLAQVSYQNLDKLYLRLYQVNPEEEFELQYGRGDLLKVLSSRQAIKEWTQNLPKYDDFHQHSTEINLGSQSFGKYILLASTGKGFAEKKSNISYSFFTVSNLSYVLSPNTQDYKMIVMDRLSGKPIEGAEISFYEQHYNQGKRKNELKLRSAATSNKEGLVQAKLDQNKSFIPKIELGKDVLFLRDRIYQSRTHKQRDRNKVNIFSDRAIYRPGQTIYFKAIAYNVAGESQLPSLLANEKLEVILKDANYQDVEKLTLTSNEYGSIHGSFTAPTGGLLGNMTIEVAGYGGHSFSVEEYKRPKFEAEFLPIEAEYALNENVVVTGKATGFAGNAIGDAKVAYRVERGVEYPYWRSYYRWYRPQAITRIKTGETISKSDGTFDIDFDLIPDPATKQKDQPVFVYTVYADITDISGETRSVQTRLRASDIALELGISASSPIERDSFKSINISSKNLNGKFQKADIDLKISSLKGEDKLYRDRFWEFPDTVSFTRSAFEKQFPDYRFSKKKQALEFEVDQVIYEENIETTEDGLVDLSKLDLKAGLYKITVNAKDKNGNNVEQEVSFEVTDQEEDELGVQTSLAIRTKQATYEPGESADLQIATSIKDAHVFLTSLRRDKSRTHKWLKFTGKENARFKISEADRGNLAVNGFVVYNNRFYSKGKQILVPWSNKNLKISYSTFRDKLLPGQEEEWIIKVEGNKKERVAAEILAGMYDASLDQFRPNSWQATYFPNLYANIQLGAGSNFRTARSNQLSYPQQDYFNVEPKAYRQFDWLGYNSYGNWNYPTRSIHELASTSAGVGGRKAKRQMNSAPAAQMDEARSMEFNKEESGFAIDGVQVRGDVSVSEDFDNTLPTSEQETDKAPQVRKNLNETVFFFPDLHTDKDGNVLVKFKMNEALTKWKFMAFAHTKELATAISTKEIVTQKKLMVQPNAPRFFREGDKIRYSAKVSNLTEKPMEGSARLELYDAITNESLDIAYANKSNSKSFSIAPGESAPLFWDLDIPKDKLGTVLHRVIAEAGEHADGEESAVPVLTNRKLVTETMPMPLRAGENKEFVFKTMRDNTSTTLTHHAFTLEFTSNPAWYAVQSLPYLMEYPYKCTEQIFNKYYANALASHVANSTPKIKQIFEAWKGTDAMDSNLSKNQELKSALLEETPWVLDAQNEEQQRRNIGLLFDLNKMSNEKTQALKVLTERQLTNGGFAWFPGGRDSWYITQYLVEGIGHLKTLGVDLGSQDMNVVLQKALRYIDARVVEHHERIKKYNKNPGLDGMVIHYLYARSFFTDVSLNSPAKKVMKYYQDRIEKDWLQQGLYYQGMLALAADRFDLKQEAQGIVASLSERALSHEELGKYWNYDRGYYWHQMPIETHSLMIEVFEQVAKDKEMVDELRLWLLKNKQTNAWETTKATAAAVYALLMSGDAWLQETKQVDIIFPNKILNADMAKSQANAEAGTGYFKHRWDEVNPNLSSVKVSNPNTVPAWGAAYWQYFEDLDKITDFEETPLKLNKKVFKESQGDRGAVINEVGAGAKLEVGDKLVVRIELRVDRDMEFIHMKDMRASGFEPMNVFSQYKWQGGLGYYESTKDASTNFFFDQLPKGTYVFEYPVRVVHQGDFSNGVTTIQSMYAPEFASHSKGMRISVNN